MIAHKNLTVAYIFRGGFLRTLLCDGCADVQIRGLVFDVLCQGEYIVQLGMTLFQVVLCCLPVGGTSTNRHSHTKRLAHEIRFGPPIWQNNNLM